MYYGGADESCQGGRLYMSIRKISDINEPIFTIALSKNESGFC